MREEVSRVTQPVQVIRKEEAVILKYCEVDLRVLKSMEHLKKIYTYGMKNCRGRNRILLQSPKTEISRQAAAAFTNLLQNGYAEHGSYLEDEWELDETDEPWGEAEEERPWGEQDCLILDAGKLAGNADEDAVPQMVLMQMGNGGAEKQQKLFDAAEQVLVECSGRFDEEKLMEILENQLCGTIIVSVPDLVEKRNLAERLMFEQGFELLEAAEPKPEYYADLLKRYLKERGYFLREEGGEAALLEELMRFRGERFSENDVFLYADRAIERKGSEGAALRKEDFQLPDVMSEGPSQNLLDEMIGLKKVKRQIEKLCAVRTIQELYPAGGTFGAHHHLAFAGAPGTGKSEVARLYSRILAERRVTNGRFVSVKRADMIGKYVGHTAPKLRKLFEQADGGILFIDEAGGLTTEDDFTREAVTELVRFMEERPKTTVIFATYPEKMQEFLNKDAGLSSRISKVLHFPSYNEEELVQIFRHLAGKSGWNLEDGVVQILKPYIVQLKRAQGPRFGNAREMRKLLENAVENGCHRMCRKMCGQGQNGQGLPERILLVSDVKEAMREIMPKSQESHRIGFAIPGNEYGK